MTPDEAAANRRARLFPALDPDQIARIAACGHERTLVKGEVLIEHGAVHVPFFVVLDGAIEVIVPRGGEEHAVVVHRKGEFTGEVGMLSARRSVATIRAIEPSRVLELAFEDIRRLMAIDAELGEVLLRVFILRRAELIAQGTGDLVLVGSRHSADTLALEAFLIRNGHPHVFLDVERDPAVEELLERLHVGVADVPIVILACNDVLKRPTLAEVAGRIGINSLNTTHVHDVVIVGAGPAGLATAVYAASEGLDVVVLEASAPGGQAGTSSRIENYLGFPTGISGRDLAARANVQATKFGAAVSIARVASRLTCDGVSPYRIELEDGEALQARAVVIATGARYRHLEVPDLERFIGNGVYYAATEMEAALCQADNVAIVGGGNSAGQAAVFLARRARKVHILVRGPGLAESMSRYLIQRIEETPNIELHTHTRVTSLEGKARVERMRCVDGGGEGVTYDVAHAFVMTGAEPATAWLGDCVTLDDAKFVKTGGDLTKEELAAAGWKLARDPLLYETSRPRVFAVGDVRAQSVKRVAAAVGEGSTCVQLIHRVLAE